MIDENVLWIAFFVIVFVLLFLDFFVFNRKPDSVTTKKAAIQTLFFVSVALVFGVVVLMALGAEKCTQYYTGYVLEESMSVDNLFVFILIFSMFKIPDRYQHKVLFFGIVGAMVFRILFIFAGSELVERFDWILYIFGALLIFVALKTMLQKEDSNNNRVAEFFSRHLRTSQNADGGKFLTMENGKRMMTPLLLALIVIEVSDLIFAIDSIPAILSITTDKFIVYSSNIFAILGLRSLYFVVRQSMVSLKYLKYGLGAILLFIGAKIFLKNVPAFDFITENVFVSLLVIVAILAITIVASVISGRKTDSA